MRPLRHILSAESPLAGFLDRRRNEQAILQHVRRNVPPALASQVGIAAAEPPELALLAGSGAACALLRQRVPDLVEKLAREGWQFTGIQVRVQARPRGEPAQKIVPKQLDDASVATLRARALALADPALAAAVRRLADHAGKDASDDKQEPLESVEHQRAK